jgi:hypothetical protein
MTQLAGQTVLVTQLARRMATILFHMGCVSVAVGEFRRSKHSL